MLAAKMLQEYSETMAEVLGPAGDQIIRNNHTLEVPHDRSQGRPAADLDTQLAQVGFLWLKAGTGVNVDGSGMAEKTMELTGCSYEAAIVVVLAHEATESGFPDGVDR